jgi:hypothetical protein
VTRDPVGVLGLAPDAGLTDDDVRAAWRRIAAATHPDRADGGDPAAFARAAQAYNELRTPVGRGEARAELSAVTARPPARRSAWLVRPARLAARVLVTGAFCAGVIAVAGWRPATPALVVGALTWLVRSARHDVRAPGAGPPKSRSAPD